jgi:hypothetical protein
LPSNGSAGRARARPKNVSETGTRRVTNNAAALERRTRCAYHRLLRTRASRSRPIIAGRHPRVGDGRATERTIHLIGSPVRPINRTGPSTFHGTGTRRCAHVTGVIRSTTGSAAPATRGPTCPRDAWPPRRNVARRYDIRTGFGEAPGAVEKCALYALRYLAPRPAFRSKGALVARTYITDLWNFSTVTTDGNVYDVPTPVVDKIELPFSS